MTSGRWCGRGLTVIGLSVIGLAVALGLAPSAAHGARFDLLVLDGANEGFNDPTPMAPVAGNPGTTLGEQRRNAFEAATREWGARLASDVEILITGDWVDRTDDCETDTGPVANAGPTVVAFGFPGAPKAKTWYVGAQVNALAGEEQFVAPLAEISASFNSAVGSPGCLTDLSWDYRVGAGPAKRRRISFVETALHEIGHGLGFLTLVDLETGEKFQNRNDAFMQLLEDHSRGKKWPKLTKGQRVSSATDDGDLHWVGPNTVTSGHILAAGRDDGSGHVLIYAPPELDTGSSVSHFDTSLDANTGELMEPFVLRFEDVLLADRVLQDLGWGINLPAVRAIDDLNGNGGTDLAVLRVAEDPGGHKVVLLDGKTHDAIHEVRIAAQFSAIDLRVIPHFDGSGADELAILAWRARGKRIRVFVFDGGTGEELATLSFPKGFAFALEVIPSFGGSSADEVVVLARRDNGANRIWSKDPQSGNLLSTVSLSSAFLPADLAVLSNFSGTAASEIAIVVQNLSSGVPEVHTYDAGSGAQLSSFSLQADFVPRHVTAIPSFGSTGADELAIAGQREGDGQVRLVVVDASSGLQLSERSFGSKLRPLAIETVPDFGNTPAAEVALLTRLTKSEKTKVFVVDASSGMNLRTFTLPKKNNPRALGVLPSLGATQASEVAVVTTLTRTGEIRAIVRDAASGNQLFDVVVP